MLLRFLHPESIPSCWGQTNLTKLPSAVSSQPLENSRFLDIPRVSKQALYCRPTSRPTSLLQVLLPLLRQAEKHKSKLSQWGTRVIQPFLPENTNSLCRWSLGVHPLRSGEERGEGEFPHISKDCDDASPHPRLLSQTRKAVVIRRNGADLTTSS